MPKNEIIFKPRYRGSMRFAVLLWPVWTGLFIYFLYQGMITGSYNPEGLLAFIFGAMAVSLPFRVFRQARFLEKIVVKRFLMPDLVIEYKDITGLTPYGLKARSGNISLQMLDQKSMLEFVGIINSLISEKKIKLKKIV
jgi:hypothetical protein